MDILSKIEQSRFIATEADIERLAREQHDSLRSADKASGTYLKVLVALTAQKIGETTLHLGKRRGKASEKLASTEIAEHLQALEATNAMAYAAVSRAVVTADIERSENVSTAEKQRRATERNRRTNYARTAMSAVRAFVEAGRDVRDVDLSTATKGYLRQVAERYAPPPVSVSAARLLRAVERDAERVVSEAKELAAVDPLKATSQIEMLMATLAEVADHIRAGDYTLGMRDSLAA